MRVMRSKRPTAAAALPGRAAIAVICGGDGLPRWLAFQEVSQVRAIKARLQRRLRQSDTKLLIEIAVVEIPLPIHADERAAHHTRQVRIGKVVPQELHIGLKAALRYQR